MNHPSLNQYGAEWYNCLLFKLINLFPVHLFRELLCRVLDVPGCCNCPSDKEDISTCFKCVLNNMLPDTTCGVKRRNDVSDRVVNQSLL